MMFNLRISLSTNPTTFSLSSILAEMSTGISKAVQGLQMLKNPVAKLRLNVDALDTEGQMFDCWCITLYYAARTACDGKDVVRVWYRRVRNDKGAVTAIIWASVLCIFRSH